MPYSYSSTDNRNISWMRNDQTRATLRNVRLTRGHLRSLHPFELALDYPVTAIAGPNGSGKSTLLAIAACAYHNSTDGYIPRERISSYYRFSDFFIQSREEVPPEGISISYHFLHNRWRGAEPGLGRQIRTKSRGGKWNNYNRRIKRNVVYFGVQRVVPYYERRTYKSYRRHFSSNILELAENIQQEICTIAGRIIGRTYDNFEFYTHSKYSLPIATNRGIKYSGFNMGAGEITVFDILSTIFEAGSGTLLIIDEIELGLHEQAQNRLISELKELCNVFHCQIICSTHSSQILESLPPEGRFFLKVPSNLPESYPKFHPVCKRKT